MLATAQVGRGEGGWGPTLHTCLHLLAKEAR